jgi:sulfur-oxidizing protein SoxY
VPPFFIDTLKIWQGDDLVMTMDGGIAIAEDPNIRFNYKPNGAADFRVEAVDTSKHVFKDGWPIEKSML